MSNELRPTAEKPRDDEDPRKFEVGRRPATPPPEHIPWAYGYDRVTAMVVDPDRLFAYWEVTEDAIARARERLGPGGAEAWLDVRVYDVTGRIFDGTNAHAYFDHRVERHERQWFFHIGKPTSTACVEIGLRSHEGFFVRIARSGRVDFPRREPAPPAEPRWLTVRAATGPLDTPTPGAWRGPPGWGGPDGGGPGGAGDGGAGDGGYTFTHTEVVHRIIAQLLEHRWEWERFFTVVAEDGMQTLEWEGPALRWTWESELTSMPLELPQLLAQRFEGRPFVYDEGGVTHIVHGPWQIVVRGLGARGERRVLARWEMVMSWVTSAGHAVTGEVWRAATPGGSELRLGASERRWLGASELARRGGSEVHQVGASELRLAGASELRFAGASEARLRGASELRLAGGSEARLGGASERRMGGSSEQIAPLIDGWLGYPALGDDRKDDGGDHG